MRLASNFCNLPGPAYSPDPTTLYASPNQSSLSHPTFYLLWHFHSVVAQNDPLRRTWQEDGWIDEKPDQLGVDHLKHCKPFF